MMAKRERVTVWDVAQTAAVSAQTVSRTLSGRGYVSEATRRKVLDAVDALGYKPNVLGKSLRSARSPMVGLLVADVSNPFYARLHRALENVLRDSGLTVFLLNCDDDPEVEARQLELLASYRPSGLIISPAAGSRFGAADAAAFTNVVLVSRTLAGVDSPTVQTNESEMFATAVQELFDNGHTSIAAILGNESVSTTRLRRAGLEQALAQNPRCSAVIHYTDGSAGASHDATQAILQNSPTVTGIIAFNGPVTEGVLEAIRDADLTYPEDMSVVGFTDAGWMRASHPSITAVRQPVEEMGRRAGELMAKLVAGDDVGDDTHVVVPGSLVSRESVTVPKRREQS